MEEGEEEEMVELDRWGAEEERESVRGGGMFAVKGGRSLDLWVDLKQRGHRRRRRGDHGVEERERSWEDNGGEQRGDRPQRPAPCVDVRAFVSAPICQRLQALHHSVMSLLVFGDGPRPLHPRNSSE